VPARQEKPVKCRKWRAGHCAARRSPYRAAYEDDPVALWCALSLRESLLQTRQTALDVSRQLTPSRS